MISRLERCHKFTTEDETTLIKFGDEEQKNYIYIYMYISK